MKNKKYAKNMLLAVFIFAVMSTFIFVFHNSNNSIPLKTQSDSSLDSNYGTVLSAADDEEVADRCIAGYNPGYIVDGPAFAHDPNSNQFQDNAFTTAQQSEPGMSYVVTIVTHAGQIDSVLKFIANAVDSGLTPLIRFCYNSDDPNHCSDFKSPDGMVDFLTLLIERSRSRDSFVVIAGPNEPGTENWVPEDQIGNYTKEVLNKIWEIRNHDKATIISPAFNLHNCGVNAPRVEHFFNQLGDEGLSRLDGFTVNFYIGEGTWDIGCYDLLRQKIDNRLTILNTRSSRYRKRDPHEFKTYFTEFGAVNNDADGCHGLKYMDWPEDQQQKVIKAYRDLASDERPEVAVINFFVPFWKFNHDDCFEKHFLRPEDYREIARCSLTGTETSGRPAKYSGGVYVPTAHYYSPQYENYTMRSCERISGGPFVLGWFRLHPYGEGLYKGLAWYTTQIPNFPYVNHLGSGELLVDDDSEGIRTEGTDASPYEPLCFTLAKLIDNSNLITTNEHAGIVKFKIEGKLGPQVAVPKLGSATACLNLLSLLNPLSKETGEIQSKYIGFSRQFVGSDYYSFINKGIQEIENKQSRSAKNLSDEFINFLKNLFSGNTSEYERDYFPNEPKVEYEDVDYCEDDSKSYHVKHINRKANKDDAVDTGEQLTQQIHINFSIDYYCKNEQFNDDILIVVGIPFGNAVRDYLCQPIYERIEIRDEAGNIIGYENKIIGWEQKEPLPADLPSRTLFLRQQLPTPHIAEIPGLNAGYGRLLEYSQIVANDGHNLIFPENGAVFDVVIRYRDPWRYGETGVGNYIIPDSDDPNIELIRIAKTTPVLDEIAPLASPEGYGFDSWPEQTVEFAIPFDPTMNLLAIYYQYSQSKQANSFFYEGKI
ncbi:hypothetical protein GF362_00240 [Candidatus Dojkabacteria bacterium]|nr:hypothetical protein [Candidatus Dojkabacteria bacterium]